MSELVDLRLRRRALEELRFDERQDVVRRVRLDDQVSESALAVEVRQERAERMRGSDLLIAVREDDADTAMQSACEIPDEIEARRIGFLQIFEDQEDRAECRGVLE